MATSQRIRLWIAVPAVLALLAGLLTLGACNNGGTSGKADLAITFIPNPVPLAGDGKWYFKVYLRETNSVGVSILGYTIASYDANGALKTMDFYTADDFDTLFGCDSLANYIPGGLQACTDSITTTGTAGYKIWSFSGLDDKGNAITASARVTLS